MIKIIMIRKIIEIDIDQIVKIGQHIEIEVSMDKIIEEGHFIMSMIIEMTLEETIFEICKITEVKILEEDTEGMIEMTIVVEVGVVLEIDNIQIISKGVTGGVVGLDQLQEPVQIGIELDAIYVGNIIILLRLSNFTGRKRIRANTTDV